jgi:hypothetical protein
MEKGKAFDLTLEFCDLFLRTHKYPEASDLVLCHS